MAEGSVGFFGGVEEVELGGGDAGDDVGGGEEAGVAQAGGERADRGVVGEIELLLLGSLVVVGEMEVVSILMTPLIVGGAVQPAMGHRVMNLSRILRPVVPVCPRAARC